MRWSLLLSVAVVSCASRAQPTVIGNRGHAPTVTVRMAERLEFVSAGGRTKFGAPCPAVGEPARDLYEPVLAFARANLVDDEIGISIKVEPRSQIGELRISGEWEDGSATAVYCLHVVRDPHSIVVVARQRWSVSSALSEMAKRRADRIVDGADAIRKPAR